MELCEIGGKRICYGFNGLVMGGLDSSIMRNANCERNLASGEHRRGGKRRMVLKLTRKQYTDLFGPTTGDKVRLGDTDLMVQIEKDLITPETNASLAEVRL